MIAKDELLKKYHISDEDFIAADISWEDLTYIYQDYLQKYEKYKQIKNEFQTQYLSEKDLDNTQIHSMRSRVKAPEHLIAKIIRNRTKHGRKYKALTKENYEKILTDLIGFRCLILFKSQWVYFHQYITKRIENELQYYVNDSLTEFDDNIEHTYHAEAPKVHIRNGDRRDIYENVRPKVSILSDKNYRSVHYIIKYQGVYLEIQLRTLFEEAWGEIDHSIVYPNYVDTPFMLQYTALLNRLTGLADEMGSFFQELEQVPDDDMPQLSGSGEYGPPPLPIANLFASTSNITTNQCATPEELINQILQE